MEANRPKATVFSFAYLSDALALDGHSDENAPC